MITKSILHTISAIAVTCALLSGCSKETVNTLTQKESDADKNSVFAQQTYDQEQFIVDAAIISYITLKSANSGLATGSDCLHTTFDVLSSPMKATLDFGINNCLCSDGKNRRGKIIVTFTGAMMDSATSVVSSFENYFVNDNQVRGTSTVTNKGHNTSGHLNYQIITDGSIVMANNGGTIEYKTNHNREWTEGENTPLVSSDDVYSFSGSSTGKTVSNQDFTMVITSPLVWTASCNRFVSGIFELTPSGEATRTLDFGNGMCDAYATITVLGFTFQITLP